MAKRLTATVRGRVQGVGYRMFARDAARRLGLGGTVRNLADGSVQVVADGTPEALTAFILLLERGPWGARVEHVESEWTELHDESARASFEVVG